MAHIVACDDEKDILDLLKEFLSESGHTVDATTDPSEVIPLIASKPCDLAIIDYRMNKMDGKTLLGAIRKVFSPVELPIAFLSGEKDKTLVQDLARLGISSFFLKPPNYEAMSARIQEIVAERLSLTDVRGILNTCNVPDKALYSESGLSVFRGRAIPLFQVSYRDRKYVVAQIEQSSPRHLAQMDGLQIVRGCRILALFGNVWFRSWPSYWMLEQIKNQAPAQTKNTSDDDVKAIFAMVSRIIEER